MKRATLAVAILLPTLAAAQDIGTSGALERPVVGCKSHAIVMQALLLLQQRDQAAAQRLLEREDCVNFPAGEFVTVTDRSGLALCLRARGVPDCYWSTGVGVLKKAP